MIEDIAPPTILKQGWRITLLDGTGYPQFSPLTPEEEYLLEYHIGCAISSINESRNDKHVRELAQAQIKTSDNH